MGGVSQFLRSLTYKQTSSNLPTPVLHMTDTTVKTESANGKPEVSIDMGTTALEWNGPDDPDNPVNWPKWQRYWHIVPPAIISFTATLGSSIYTPAYPIIQEEFKQSSTVALLPFALYVLALGFGPLIAAPLSETYGRYIVYTVSTPIAAVFTVGAGFSQNIHSLCVLRFLAGMAFSPSLAIGTGSVGDLTVPEKRAVPSALYIMSPFLGPAFGPVIGSIVTVKMSWRWTQWTLVFFAILSMAVTLLSQETYKPIILSRRAKRQKISLPSGPSPLAKLSLFLTITLIRPLHMLITEPIVALFSLYTGFNFSIIFGFMAAYPYVFRTVYDFDTIPSGLIFLAIGFGGSLAVPTVLLCDRFLYQPRVRESKAAGRSRAVAPEYRLYPSMIGCFGLPLALFWFAWTARPSVSWWCPVVASIPFAWGNSTIFISATAYLLDTYQSLYGASAMAANALVRYTMGAALPLFTLQMYKGMGIDWATSLLGFVSVVCIPIPWILFFYGHKIRSRSGYETAKSSV
ncbi:MFS multidrug transporter-like protein [Boeremia exigua]|uniref:MFS multidrug transporter-like protein n=1 Tax=Boeremia exigua TaxID=749465 RepID=UPI001E8CDE19|nr:MFS multidrug transporter-like protein [Boeremia exigua]KAH6613083.1 MFS multidrug transporter-like protein [Boeremia exigua]